MNDLLPCPFCGGEAEMLLVDETDHGYCVSCKQCYACGPVRLSLKDDGRPHAALSWNRRDAQWDNAMDVMRKITPVEVQEAVREWLWANRIDRDRKFYDAVQRWSDLVEGEE